MSRRDLVLHTDFIRAKAKEWVDGAERDTRLSFQDPKRTLPQNNKFWAMLTEIAEQKEHFGRKYDTETWKALLMQAWGREVKFIPTLSGDGVMPIMYSSSALSIQEMADLIEFMLCWGTQNGVVFHDNQGGPPWDDGLPD